VVLEDQEQRQDLTGTAQEPLEGIEGSPPALRGIQPRPPRDVEEGEQGG
jgi:hypothetical protein